MRHQLSALTALRGYAVMWVMCFHFLYHVFKQRSYLRGLDIGDYEFLSALSSKGYLGVDVFFVLSGFVLAYTYREAFQGKAFDRPTLTGFWIRRIGRIFPLHVVVLAGLIFIDSADIRPVQIIAKPASDAIAYNFFLVHSWGIYPAWAWNSPSWSVSVEWGVYLIFPLITLLVPTGSKARRCLLTIASALGGLYWFIWRYNEKSMDLNIDYGLLRGLTEFITGYCLCSLYSSGFLKQWRWNLISPAIAASVLVAVFLGAQDMTIVLCICAFIYSSVFLSGVSAQVIANPVAVYLGKISYSLYLLQLPFYLFAGGLYRFTYQLPFWFHDERTQASMAWGFIVFILLLIALASLSYLVIETPARKAFKRLAEKLAPSSPRRAR
jgi:peptidoglycan/LPS O-acetylase OafA/YrhL